MPTDTTEYVLAPVSHADIGRALRLANGQIREATDGLFAYDGEAIWYTDGNGATDVVATTVIGRGEPIRKLLVEPAVDTEYPTFFDAICEQVEGDQ